MYKFQTRQQKIEQREDSSSRYSDLHKINSYTPGHWKNYIPTEVSHSTEKRSIKTPSYYNRAEEANYDVNIEEDSRIKSILNSRKEQQKKRQQSAMRKVRELQQKVLPLVKNNRDEEDEVWIGWQSRIEQKVLRLEGQVDNMKKQMQLQLQKRIVQLQNRWQNKFSDYFKGQKNETYPSYMQN